MALRSFSDMSHGDEEMYDLAKGMPKDYDPPEYPPHLQFTISKEALAQAGAEDGEPDDEMRFSTMGDVTSVFRGRENSRIELELTQFAGEDGKFFDLDQPSHICLCGPELEKMNLDDDAEKGDLIHLIGTARLEHLSSSEWGGDMVCLQITELTYEDESDESRDGGGKD